MTDGGMIKSWYGTARSRLAFFQGAVTERTQGVTRGGMAARKHCMDTPTSELILVSDEELQKLAEEFGPTSAEVQVLAQLASQRAQDLQVFAFRVADQYLTGPLPETAAQASAPDPLSHALSAKPKDLPSWPLPNQRRTSISAKP